MSIKKIISTVAGTTLVLSFALALTVSAASFSRDLTVGSKGADVKDLQVWLNANGYTIATSGAGSMGKETTTFGPATKAAVMKFQKAKGLATVGRVGPATRAILNGVASNTTTNTTSTNTTTVVSVGTGLSVSAPVQPANSVAPASAARVPFTKVTLTAGNDGDVTVNSLTVARTGLANDAAFSGIVLLDENGTQIGIAKTLNSNHQTFVGEPIVIKAGTSRTLTVGGNMTDAATMASYAGQVATLTVVGVNTSATVSGSLPVSGAAHTMNATSLIGSVTMQRGSIDPGASQTKEVGTTNYIFTSVKVTAGSAEPVLLQSVRWNQTGSIGAGDLANLKTWVDGVSYPVVVSSNGQYYTTVFPGNGITIDKGFSKDISISGDIIGGSSRTIDFDIAKRTDIAVTGALFGYGIIPPQTGVTAYSQSSNASQFSSSEDPWYSASEVTVNTGVVTVSSDTSVSAQNIAINLQNQPLGGFSVEVRGEPVTIARMVFNVTAVGDTVAHITNVSLVDQNGSVLAGPVDGSGAAQNGTFTFTDTVTFPVGTTKFALKGKLSTDFASNDTVQASTTPATQWSTVTGVTTGKSVTPAPASAISGNTMTVKAGALNISVSSQPTARYVIAGANGFEFARYVLDAGQSGEDLRVTSLPLLLALSTVTASNLTSCQLFDGATAITTGSNLVNPSAAGDNTFTFDGTGLIVPKGTAKTISLKCNLSTSASSGTVAWGLTDNHTTYTAASGVTSGQTVAETMTAAAGQTMTASTGGSYTVTADTSSAYYYRAVKAGSTNVPLAAFKFTAGNTEDIMLKKVALQLGNTASSAPADLVGQKVTLWYNGTQVGEAQFGGASADNATSTLTTAVKVTRGETATIVVKGDIINHDSNTNSDSTATNGGYGAFVAVTYDADNNGLNGNYATGVDSGSNISGGTSSDVTTTGVRVFRNVPTFATVSPASTGLATGEAQIYTFKVTNPDSGRDLVLEKLTFSVATSSNTEATFKLYGDGVAANASGVAATGSTGSQLVTITFDATSNAKIVSAGSSKTFVLKGVVTAGGSSTNRSVTVALLADRQYPSFTKLMGNATQAGAGTAGDVSTASGNIVWSPFSTTTAVADSATESNLDWTNGYGLPGFPAPGQNLDSQTYTSSN
ncbi:MAG: hypothetical protein RLZZ347_412 [Candidatus Parcubacteria bacterium]|jgi:peptidoglycan hydrolase-like protein with peptidoglycan-binding domain